MKRYRPQTQSIQHQEENSPNIHDLIKEYTSPNEHSKLTFRSMAGQAEGKKKIQRKASRSSRVSKTKSFMGQEQCQRVQFVTKHIKKKSDFSKTEPEEIKPRFNRTQGRKKGRLGNSPLHNFYRIDESIESIRYLPMRDIFNLKGENLKNPKIIKKRLTMKNMNMLHHY